MYSLQWRRVYSTSFVRALILFASSWSTLAQSQASSSLPVAPDALGRGRHAVASGEYKLQAAIDTAVLPGKAVELWASVHWPKDLPSKGSPVFSGALGGE